MATVRCRQFELAAELKKAGFTVSLSADRTRHNQFIIEAVFARMLRPRSMLSSLRCCQNQSLKQIGLSSDVSVEIRAAKPADLVGCAARQL
jgi:hypothetical protein